MIRPANRPRQAETRHRPRYDVLEARIALSIDGDPGINPELMPTDGASVDVGQETGQEPLSVGLIDPSPGSLVTASPPSVVLAFNRPIFPDTVNCDVVVVRIGTDDERVGQSAPYDLTVDPSATRLTAVLPEPLGPGQYEVRILGRSGIMDVDWNYLTDGLNDIVVDRFDVVVPGVTLDDAVDLGGVGPTPMEFPGALDFRSGSLGVSLYRIHLDPGHFWRLGLEVNGQRDGGTLDSALALFDEQGRTLSTDEVGRKDFPSDPYLFAGLDPGTYYVGVSGRNNLPGTGRGYDPATGFAGFVSQTQDGGPYTLHVVAEPVDDLPRLRNFAVDRADSIHPFPTGLTLGFSRAISLTSPIGELSPALNMSIEVLDEDGRVWPVQVSGYDEGRAEISYLFDELLPAGHYTVTLPNQGGLTDLAGLTPVAQGQSPRTLAQFDVLTHEESGDPLDLGAILPDAAVDGVGVDVTLSEGQEVASRLVVTVPGIYEFLAQSDGGTCSIEISGPGPNTSLHLEGSRSYAILSPGAHTIRFQTPMAGPVHVHLTVLLSADDTEIVLANGVGQGPAISLRLISISARPPAPAPPAPDPVIPAPLPIPSPTTPTTGGLSPTAPTSSKGTASPGPMNGPVPLSAPTITTTFLGPASDLVGRPILEATGRSQRSEASAGGESQALLAVTAGQSFHVMTAQPARSLTAPSDRFLAGVPANTGVSADMLEVVVGRTVEIVMDVRQAAMEWSSSAAARVRSWSLARQLSGESPGQIARSLPGQAAALITGTSTAVRDDATVDATGIGAEFLTHPVVVLVTAVISQMGWHGARWWRSRRALSMAGPLKYAATDPSSGKRTPLDPILQWDGAILISRPLFRRDRAC